VNKRKRGESCDRIKGGRQTFTCGESRLVDETATKGKLSTSALGGGGGVEGSNRESGSKGAGGLTLAWFSKGGGTDSTTYFKGEKWIVQKRKGKSLRRDSYSK